MAYFYLHVVHFYGNCRQIFPIHGPYGIVNSVFFNQFRELCSWISWMNGAMGMMRYIIQSLEFPQITGHLIIISYNYIMLYVMILIFLI